MSELSSVTVVMATFHSAHCVPELASCLAEFPYVHIVDNASSDDTVPLLRQLIPHARIIVNPRNRGFGAANNQAIELAQTKFVLLLNPDCIISPEAVQEMIRTADRHPSAAAVGPQLLGRKGQLDLSYCMQAGTAAPRSPAAEGELCVGFLSGACMLIHRSAMEQVGGFDEAFFLYQEDADLCVRLARDCGELILAPQARVVHYSRGSSGGKGIFKAEYNRGYHQIQSKFLYAQKHLGAKIGDSGKLKYAATAALESLLRILLLDFRRAARTWGRVMGVLRSRRH